tara:strand:+ start:354 stop:587 length:234 start_codon:yes stop_codon:yes gene_type:complete
MSLLTYISGVPLFSTLIEAIEWGENRGLTGYHTHDYEGQTGYMGGSTHPNATRQTNSPAPTSSVSGSGSSSGGGGGY